VVGKVGTDLHTSTFDPDVAIQLSKVAAVYGSVIKGHYSDNVINPEAYPLSGMGAANVGPEFTEREYEGLMELCTLEHELHKNDSIARPSELKAILWNAVIASQRWKKWLHEGESANDFYQNSLARQEWLIKTGCRYIWENTEVVAARLRLYRNLQVNNVDAEGVVLSHIEKAMDKYFHKFNLVDLNQLIEEEALSLA
jgi:tagatose-1,6-bisphosphate aldolase non-catalytic subunit AgaZ/GatZ